MIIAGCERDWERGHGLWRGTDHDSWSHRTTTYRRHLPDDPAGSLAATRASPGPALKRITIPSPGLQAATNPERLSSTLELNLKDRKMSLGDEQAEANRFT